MTIDLSRFDRLSREIALVCQPDGQIVWADAKAVALLGDVVGQPLRALAAPDGAAAADALLTHAATALVQDWPLTLAGGGQLQRWLVSAAPDAAGILLCATRPATALPETGETGSADVSRLQRLLADAQRGMESLYGELSDQEARLRRAFDIKGRVAANLTHEIRSPLNSLLSLAALLLDDAADPLSADQREQVEFMLKSARDLSRMINDLLDLSQLEHGTLTVRPVPCDVAGLLSALRGQVMAARVAPGVTVHIDESAALPPLLTDDGKVIQILRQLLNNAIKFTEQGTVRLTVRPAPGGQVAFAVTDSGIGIDPADHERIFDEFVQLDSPLQRRARGIGLGLSLSRRLSELLGGTLTVRSERGRGTTFELTIPAVLTAAGELAALAGRGQAIDPSRNQVLVVEDDPPTLYLYEKYLNGSGYQVIPARTVAEAREALTRFRPAAIVLDVMLDGEVTWNFLAEIKADAATCDVPVLVVTVMDREQSARALGADDFQTKPVNRDWLVRKLELLAGKAPTPSVVVIDDDEVARLVIRRMLRETKYTVLEAEDGAGGIKLAHDMRPQLILLDFNLPDLGCFEVLDALKADPVTRPIPVIIVSAMQFSAEELARLQSQTASVLNKQDMSRELALARIRDALDTACAHRQPQTTDVAAY